MHLHGKKRTVLLALLPLALAATPACSSSAPSGPQQVAVPDAGKADSRGFDDGVPSFRFAMLASGLESTFQLDKVDLCVTNKEADKNSATGAGYFGPLGKLASDTRLPVPGVTNYWRFADMTAEGNLYLRIQRPGTDCATGFNQIRVIKDPTEKVTPGDSTYVVYGSFSEPGKLIGKIIQDPAPNPDAAMIQVFNGTGQSIEVLYLLKEDGTPETLAGDIPSGVAASAGMRAGKPTHFSFAAKDGTFKQSISNEITFENDKGYTFFVYTDDANELHAFGCENRVTSVAEGGLANPCNFKEMP
jgi:hypothetical protein